MAKINYFYTGKRDRILRLTALTEGSASAVCFSFTGISGGLLYIGGIKAIIENGEVTLSLMGLKDGVYSPTVIADGFSAKGTPFAKIENKIYPCPADGKRIIDIEKRLCLLENDNIHLQKQIKELEKKISSGSVLTLNERI